MIPLTNSGIPLPIWHSLFFLLNLYLEYLCPINMNPPLYLCSLLIPTSLNITILKRVIPGTISHIHLYILSFASHFSFDFCYTFGVLIGPWLSLHDFYKFLSCPQFKGIQYLYHYSEPEVCQLSFKNQFSSYFEARVLPGGCPVLTHISLPNTNPSFPL